MNNERPVPRWALQHCCEQVSIWKIGPKIPYLQTTPKVEGSEFTLEACEKILIINAGRLLVEGKIATGPAQVHILTLCTGKVCAEASLNLPSSLSGREAKSFTCQVVHLPPKKEMTTRTDLEGQISKPDTETCTKRHSDTALSTINT